MQTYFVLICVMINVKGKGSNSMASSQAQNSPAAGVAGAIDARAGIEPPRSRLCLPPGCGLLGRRTALQRHFLVG
jgi:hypothetical protein